MPNPALFARTSYRYGLDLICPRSLSIPSAQLRSAAHISVCTPYLSEHSAATLFSAASFLPVRNTLKPAAENSAARAFPIPDEAPVMIAHFIDHPGPDYRSRRCSADRVSSSDRASTAWSSRT